MNKVERNDPYPFCLPVLASSEAEVTALVRRYEYQYQYFEIWLDYIEDLSDELIISLTKSYGERVIFLFRRIELTESQLSFERRRELIKLLDGSPAYLDLDLRVQSSELEVWKDLKVKPKLIASYHNYERTPDETELQDIIESMEKVSPFVKKIATYCESDQDSLRLLNLLLRLKQSGDPFVVLGMGELGKVTRVVGSLWGNAFVFAPTEGTKSSAPGQLSKAAMEEIMNLMR